MLIKNYARIAGTAPRRQALKIIESGLRAIETKKVMQERVRLDGSFLKVISTGNRAVSIRLPKRIFVIGFGKASSEMAKGLERILKKRISGGLVISTKKAGLLIEEVEGTHPLPSLKNIRATKKIIRLMKSLEKDDLALCLISGGGSSLLCHPKVGLREYLKIIRKKYRDGSSIQELNKVRKKLSNVKDGRLAALTKARVVSLIFSDVLDDDISTIASGPTCQNAENIVLLNSALALEAMAKKAVSLGLEPKAHLRVSGEARITGRRLLKKRGDCILFGGETTVTVTGKGTGGRNQELCLGAIESISGTGSCMAAVNTDGLDGTSMAAGAIIDGSSLQKAKSKELSIKASLQSNDSYSFFRKMKDLIITGPTGSNVADIGVIIRRP
ncbi:MAG: DUF4147 domain-containing protein [archaeon]